MIVYREQRRRVATATLLAAARASVDAVAVPRPTHDDVVTCLIDLGVLEAAVVDALFPEVDSINRVSRTLRDASLAAGHLVWHSWYGTWSSAGPWLARLQEAIAALAGMPLPRQVDAATPEGYAQYGVYPEAYLEAVRRHAAALSDRPVACIGIRSIGTSLAGVVAAACEELGCDVVSFTIRPHGHPFDRRPVLSRPIEEIVCRPPQRTVLVVDEGPGLSGSSFAGTAEVLSTVGVQDEAIVFLPSWRADGSALRSPIARLRWQRHRQLVVDFEDIWPTRACRDLSAGAWRAMMFDRTDAHPAVHPQHERRKYVTPQKRFLRFAGLGRHGSAKLGRARDLAIAGFSPTPVGFSGGFLEYELVDGTPLTVGAVDPPLLETAARYLAHLCRTQSSEPTVSDDALTEMIHVNVAEGLGERWLGRLRHHLPLRPSDRIERSAALDGRMLPHEWLRTDRGYLKTDSVDHHDDHFFPGCQDIAWDVVGFCVELELPVAARRHFVARYRHDSGDRTIAARLPYHTIIYLAYRLGYARLAAQMLGQTPDAARFARLARRYAAGLEEALTWTSAASL